MKKQLLEIWENSRNYTLAVADAMPADMYVTGPTAAIWNFGELLNHIAYGIQWWETNYIRKTESDWNPPVNSINKEAVRLSLEKSYDLLRNTLENMALSAETSYGFHATLDHITHHRAQATIFLRYKGIIPPAYQY